MKELTDDQLNIAICEWIPAVFVIHKPKMGYYREGAHGYCNREQAWRVSEEVGRKYTMYADSTPGSDAWHDRVVLEQYPPSHITGIEALGNIHEAEKGLTIEQYASFLTALGREVGCGMHSISWRNERAVVSATARQRGIALLCVVSPELFQ